ncbi:MAG: molecular chaperone HtpG, partial [Pseudomonadota bacterium]
PVDAFWVRTALGFEGKAFKSVTQGSAELDNIPVVGEERTVKEPAKDSDVATLAALVKQTLETKVSEVRASSRLATSPACLVAADTGYDKAMEKIVSRHGQTGFGGKPILEINPTHPLIKTLSERAATGGAAPEIEDAAWLLLGSAEILDGEAPSDPTAFNRRLLDVMATRFAPSKASASANRIAADGDAGGGANAA